MTVTQALALAGVILLAAVIYDAMSKTSGGRRKQIGGVAIAPAGQNAG